MNRKLTLAEMETIHTGEAITAGAIASIVAVAIAAVIVYKLFTSSKGSTNIPGGFKFNWS